MKILFSVWQIPTERTTSIQEMSSVSLVQRSFVPGIMELWTRVQDY